MQNVKNQYKHRILTLGARTMDVGFCVQIHVVLCYLCNICYPDYSLFGGQRKGKISVERVAGNQSY
jgi:hypothetical protein